MQVNLLPNDPAKGDFTMIRPSGSFQFKGTTTQQQQEELRESVHLLRGFAGIIITSRGLLVRCAKTEVQAFKAVLEPQYSPAAPNEGVYVIQVSASIEAETLVATFRQGWQSLRLLGTDIKGNMQWIRVAAIQAPIVDEQQIR